MSVESNQIELSEQINFTKERLGFVHRFARDIIGHSDSHFDVGLYDGFGNEFIEQYAKHITVIDIDGETLIKGLNNPLTTSLIEQGRLDIAQMNATQIAFPSNTFTSATCIEVFGAGFKGEHEDVASVFKGIAHVLKPGGKLVFTIKSAANQRTLDMIGQYLAFDATFESSKTVEKGYPLYKDEVESIVNPLFGNIDWYGHFYFQKQNGNLLLPIPAKEDMSNSILHERFVPKIIDEENEVPIYRIGVCQKPY